MVTLEAAGRRIYIRGDTYAIKDRIKELGGHWDSEQKAWWVGDGKREAVESLLASLTTNGGEGDGQRPAEDLGKLRIHHQVEYTSAGGRTGKYYVIGKSAARLRLTNLEGSVDFWVPDDRVRVLRTYSPRQVGRGRYVREEYQTLGQLQRFVAQQRNPATARGKCIECNAWGPKGQLCTECHEGTYW